MQRISQSLTGNHALSWLLKMPSLSTNQRSVILPFIDKVKKSFVDRRISDNFLAFVGCLKSLFTKLLLAEGVKRRISNLLYSAATFPGSPPWFKTEPRADW